jgi:SAM-dependent methyltransferase
VSKDKLDSYIIKGGEEGRARLAVLARVLVPGTRALLDRFEPLSGGLAIDAGCGGGDVSFELAARVGATGRVVGFDLDESKLASARAEAASRKLSTVEFRQASVLEPWPQSGASIVYARFVLTHLARPDDMLKHAWDALAPGGVLVVEDIDYEGQFCDPPCPAFHRHRELYVAAAHKRGADPFVGRRLVRLLESAGFCEVDSCLTQPFGRSGDVKSIPSLTFAAIAEAVIASGLASAEEVARVGEELDAFAARQDTTLSLPRIFQAWGRKI